MSSASAPSAPLTRPPPRRSVSTLGLVLSACLSCSSHEETTPRLVAPPPGAATLPPPAPSSNGTTFAPKRDTFEEDATLDRATVVVQLRDANEQPMANERVFLAQISETPAPDVIGLTDARGVVTLTAPTWIGSSARVVARKGEAVFLTASFSVPIRGGLHVTLHAYPSTRDIAEAKVVFQTAVLVEAEGAELVVTEALDAWNFSAVAWLPSVPLDLPKGFTGFHGTVLTDSSLLVEVEGERARVSGTLAPGRHSLEMSWRLPAEAGSAVLAIPTPPRAAFMRVIAQAGERTSLDVATFPPATAKKTSKGDLTWVTERWSSRTEPLPASVEVSVRNVGRVPRGRPSP